MLYIYEIYKRGYSVQVLSSSPDSMRKLPFSKLVTSFIPSNLTLEGEADTNLVGGLVNLLGVERATETQGDTGAEEDVVGDSGNTTVVDLGLFSSGQQESAEGEVALKQTLAKETGSRRYLLATSRPTALPVLEFQVALAPASTWLLTLW